MKPSPSSRRIRKSKNDISSSYRQRPRKFVCSLCQRVFAKAQALGGHMSKAHPQSSEDYQTKQRIRLERQPIRELLDKAKKILEKICGQASHRSKLLKIKEMLKKGMSEDEIVDFILRHTL